MQLHHRLKELQNEEKHIIQSYEEISKNEIVFLYKYTQLLLYSYILWRLEEKTSILSKEIDKLKV